MTNYKTYALITAISFSFAYFAVNYVVGDGSSNDNVVIWLINKEGNKMLFVNFAALVFMSMIIGTLVAGLALEAAKI